ncbi:MAG: radical SAM protein [Candidatus Thermoplasmatota archaeon]|nr:radical SAM protein [Candidatus Thermoplasmatota archaeon]
MIFRAYYPKPLFPPVSLSEGCILMCRHCKGKYLGGMEKIRNSEKLVEYCRKLENGGGKGILVSGGSDREGRILNLERAIGAFKKIKEETNLIVAIHTGYVDENMADRLINACDIAFVDMIGSDETVKQVMGLGGINIYTESLKNLIDAGIPVTPHITIGLDYGNINGEYAALELIKTFPIKKIVLNIICPTKGTDFENINIPSMDEIRAIIKKSKEQELDVALGCMRPRGMQEIEEEAITEGIKNIALPSMKAIKYAEKNGYVVEKVQACCGLTNGMINKITR